MSDQNLDLLRLAAEYADKDVDLFELLGIDSLTEKDDIHRAWRKKSLKYHPDKAGANFDAAKWELFERARDVLSDPPARAAYDQASKAKLLRRQEREQMDKERQRFANDLESRENAFKQQREAQEQQNREVMLKERERLAESQRMREEEARRQFQAEQDLQDLAEAKRRLREKKEEKAKRKQAKESMRAAGTAVRSTGPANGMIRVPGDYITEGSGGKPYWELVCDKLRAVQEARNLGKQPEAGEQLAEAEAKVLDARARIQEAENTFQRSAAASTV